MNIFAKGSTPRENFLLALLNKVIQEYKKLQEEFRGIKPFKIVGINYLSRVPGETQFLVQPAYKNCAIKLTAAEIIGEGYDLKSFSDFHAELIRQAAKGKIIEFLGIREEEPEYRIASKMYSEEHNCYLFKICDRENIQFIRTADEIARDKALFRALSLTDVCDIFYTQGSESVIKEKAAMLLAIHD